MVNQGKSAVDVLLAESFKELAQKEPIDKITIKEITDKAGVIRPTFYNHFQDKYELLEIIIWDEILSPAKPLIRNGMIDEALILIFTSIQKDREFYMRASRLEGQNSFAGIVRGCIARALLEVLEDQEIAGRVPSAWLSKERIAQYHAQSMCFLVINWIQSGMTMSEREMADIYNYLIHHSIADMMGER